MAHSEVRKAHLRVWEGSGAPPGGPGGVVRPCRRTGWGRGALPEAQELSVGLLEGLGGVVRPTRRARRRREVLPQVR